MFEARNIYLSAGTKELLVNTSFRIGDKDRVGLVGLNGTGKSTLLRLIAKTSVGSTAQSNGQFIKSSTTTIGYLPQEISFEDDLEKTALHYALLANKTLYDLSEEIETLQDALAAPEHDHASEAYHQIIEKYSNASHEYERLGGYRMQAEAEKVLSGLGFSTADFSKKVKEFSGGWQMRLHICKLLLQNPTLLLLDEPTNHLDIDSLRWLENYLLNYEHSYIIVSHDRFFLDKLTTRTLEIQFKTITEYKGNYTLYEKQKAERFELMMAKYENDRKKMADLKSFVDRFRYKATKARQAQSRLRQMQKLEEELQAPEEDLSKISFSFPKAKPSGKEVMRLLEVSKSYQLPDGTQKGVLSGIDLEVMRGDRIAIVGSNGAGKTTFCKIVSGSTDFEGTLSMGHNVSLSYFAQHQTENLDSEKTILAEMLDAAPDSEAQRRVRDILGCFLFSGDAVEKKISVLSGGEKSRVALARILLQASNLLIMDEPTNHLDMRSKEMLIESLENYDGTLMLVSHDRYFLDSLVNKVIEIKNGSLTVHLGSYAEYLEKADKAFEEERKKGLETEKKNRKGKTGSSKVGKTKKNDPDPNRQNTVKLEKKIQQLEEKKKEYEATMASSTFYSQPKEETEKAIALYEKLCAEIDMLYKKWESELS